MKWKVELYRDGQDEPAVTSDVEIDEPVIKAAKDKTDYIAGFIAECAKEAAVMMLEGEEAKP